MNEDGTSSAKRHRDCEVSNSFPDAVQIETPTHTNEESFREFCSPTVTPTVPSVRGQQALVRNIPAHNRLCYDIATQYMAILTLTQNSWPLPQARTTMLQQAWAMSREYWTRYRHEQGLAEDSYKVEDLHPDPVSEHNVSLQFVEIYGIIANH